MEQRTKCFIIAVIVTILDTVVAGHYGPVIWQVFGPVSWMRFTLFLLAGTEMFTLADIWSRVFSGQGRSMLLTENGGGDAAGRLQDHTLEGADV